MKQMQVDVEQIRLSLGAPHHMVVPHLLGQRFDNIRSGGRCQLTNRAIAVFGIQSVTPSLRGARCVDSHGCWR